MTAVRTLDLETMHSDFGWPSPTEILAPTGAGPAMYARLAREKIGAALNRMHTDGTVEVGVLMADSVADTSEAPLAIVCHFSRPVGEAVLAEAHRLAWNFCHAPLLITIDPSNLRTWSCFVAPVELLGAPSPDRAELPPRVHAMDAAADRAADLLHFLNLAAGRLIESNDNRFRSDGRADRTLLANLKEVRARLVTGRHKLTVDLAHDLIARLIFIQFLFDRKDADGVSALNVEQLRRLHAERVLSREYHDLAGLLANYNDTYRLFRWLNARFNGDLFPSADGDAGWQKEMQAVRPEHLTLLSDLVSGKVGARTGQMELWRLYSFDTIPLEFVSSIYEEFVSDPAPHNRKSGLKSKTGIHYTPTHLVDFLLDAVLPWGGIEWDLKIIDPACGSGIFLVRTFQRLIHRWKLQNASPSVPQDVLIYVLRDCLVGIDVNPHAARVASFSLYLAMCDEIDPRRYWIDVRFPSLRGRTIFSSDFFSEETDGFDSVKDAGRYDLVVGNAPWGKATITEAARDWSRLHDWPIANKDIGALFLAKSLKLVRGGGRVAMIQSAGNLLLNDASIELRKRLFETAVVEEITNFTILRFKLFPSAISPACSVILRNDKPSGENTLYMCPKLLRTGEDEFRVVIDETDVHFVAPFEVLSDIWIGLMAGSRRDLDLIRRISSGKKTLDQLKESGDLTIREGVIEGMESHPDLRNRRVLFTRGFPEGTRFFLDEEALPRRRSLKVHRVTDPEAFSVPQLLIKQATRETRAVLVSGSEGVVCSQSFVSAHGKTKRGERALRLFCLMYNSAVGRYYLSMTEGRMSYRPELKVGTVTGIPLPDDIGGRLFAKRDNTDVDADAFELFKLREYDRILIEDALDYAVPELLRLTDTPGRLATERHAGADGSLERYGSTFLKVLKGAAKRAPASVTIFEEDDTILLPLRMLSVRLGKSCDGSVTKVTLSPGRLREELAKIASVMKQPRQGGGIHFQRVATLFDVQKTGSGDAEATVYLIRPDQRRYWSRSAAMRDADRLLTSAAFASVDNSIGHNK